jgi:DNA repair exonuclease SbcCD ATPase subunit
MLEIIELRLRNFRSYGDYDTVLHLDKPGITLITGEVGDNSKDSNGAGKTSVVEAIIWCLFGRLPNKARPGDAIVNQKTNKNCMVRITTKDGYCIERRRKFDGHDDLLIKTPSGEDISDSTNKNAQDRLNKIYNLDYEIFMSSVFFAQSGRPLLELSDNKRKKTIERLLCLDRYDLYVAVAKEKIDALSLELAKHNAIIEKLSQDILKIGAQIESNRLEVKQFEEQRKIRIKELLNQHELINATFATKRSTLLDELRQARVELESMTTYDIKQIGELWTKYEAKLESIHNDEQKINIITADIEKLKNEARFIENADDDDLQQQIELKQTKISKLKNELNSITKIDIISLEGSWSQYRTIEAGIIETTQITQEIKSQQSTLNGKKQLLIERIAQWKNKDGKICPECEQKIEHTHIMSRASSTEDELTVIENEINQININLNKHLAIAQKLKNKLDQAKPQHSIAEAQLINKQFTDKEQIISSTYLEIDNITKLLEKNINERKDKLARIKTEIQQQSDELDQRNTSIEQKRKLVDKHKPTLTVKEAEALLKQYESKTQSINLIEGSIASLEDQRKSTIEQTQSDTNRVKNETNPYQKIINTLEIEQKAKIAEHATSNKKVNQYNTLTRHLDYIRKSYGERRNIKAFVVRRLIPFLNDKINYYLNALNCDFRIEFNELLQAKTETYPYELWSGGERRRIDLAIMFAVHRLHNAIYDQQCNIMVLDEVERSLDTPGIDALIDILHREFSSRTVLVISHTQELRDAFPAKIVIRREERYCSRIEEVR